MECVSLAGKCVLLRLAPLGFETLFSFLKTLFFFIPFKTLFVLIPFNTLFFLIPFKTLKFVLVPLVFEILCPIEGRLRPPGVVVLSWGGRRGGAVDKVRILARVAIRIGFQRCSVLLVEFR